MSNTKHTPGPWFTNRVMHELYVEAQVPDGLIQEVAWCAPTMLNSQQGANALLIAAAPELLEFAQLVVHVLNPCELTDRARAVISKATGGVE